MGTQGTEIQRTISQNLVHGIGEGLEKFDRVLGILSRHDVKEGSVEGMLQVKEIRNDISPIVNQIKEVLEKCEKRCDDEMKRRQRETEELQVFLTDAKNELSSSKQVMEKIRKDKEWLEKNIEAQAKTVREKKSVRDKLKNIYDQQKADWQKAIAKSKKLRGLMWGFVWLPGVNVGLAIANQSAKKDAENVETKFKSSEQTLSSAEESLTKQEKNMRDKEKEFQVNESKKKMAEIEIWEKEEQLRTNKNQM